MGIPAGDLKRPGFVDKMLGEYRQLHAKGVAALKLEGDARRKAVAEFEEETGMVAKKNLLIAVMMPAITGWVERSDKTAAAREMLKLVLELGAGITEDDLEGTAFQLVRKDGGLELVSEKPATSLRFDRE